MTKAAAPHPYLALTGANPSPPGQPQEQTPVDDPHAEVEIEPQVKPRAVWPREETQAFPPAVQAAVQAHTVTGRTLSTEHVEGR